MLPGAYEEENEDYLLLCPEEILFEGKHDVLEEGGHEDSEKDE